MSMNAKAKSMKNTNKISRQLVEFCMELVSRLYAHNNFFSGNGVWWLSTLQSESSLLTFMLAMVRYPEIAKRAQAEIDSVVGRDRMPTIDDRESMPYLDCILKETLRYGF